MDSRLPVAKRTRSREARMFKEYYENLQKKKLKTGDSVSTSQSESTSNEDASLNVSTSQRETTSKEDASVNVSEKSSGRENVGVDSPVESSRVARIVCAEESANVVGDIHENPCFEGSKNLGTKDKGKSIILEGMNEAVPIIIGGSDDEMVHTSDSEDLSGGGCENVVFLGDGEDILGETGSFQSNSLADLQSDLLGKHEDSDAADADADDDYDDDEEEEKEDEEYSAELNILSSEENNDDLDDEDYVGRDLNCVAKRTRSRFMAECSKERRETGTASKSLFVDEENRELTTGLQDNDNLDGFNDETYQKACKTGAKKSRVGSGRGSRDLKSNKKHISMMKDQDVKKIILNSILDAEEIPLEDSLFSRNEVLSEERSQLDDETVLPLKFNFGYEEPTPPVKSQAEKDLDNLWNEMGFALAACEIGSTDFSTDKDEVETAVEVEQDQAACCSRGKHELILDEEIGFICKFCSFVELEIRHIVASFAENPWGRYRRDSKTEDHSGLGDLLFEDSGLDSQVGLDSFSQEEGTVWDLVPGVKNSMYPHQREGFEFIWRNIAGSIDLDTLKHPTLSDGGNGCIISHAPGTGKTRLAIVFLQAYMKMYPTCRPVIVAPCSMLLTWEEEFRKWKTGITFHNLNNPVLSSKELLNFQNPDESLSRTLKLWSWKRGGGVLGIGYSRFKLLVEGTKKKFSKVDEQVRKIVLELPGLFVFDEGHIPRNDQTGIFKALLGIRTEKRIILSGTPFQNTFEELFNTIRLVRPKFAEGMQSRDLRNSVTRRGRKRNGGNGKWAFLTSTIGKVTDDRLVDEKKLDELKTIIAPFVHVHKGTVLRESLPGLRHTVVVLCPFDLQKRLLEAVKEERDMLLKNNFVSMVSVHPSLLLDLSYDKYEFIEDMAELERLRPNPDAGIKTKFLMELLRLSDALNEKVLIFSQLLKPLSLIAEYLLKSFDWVEGREVLYMDGKQDVRLRQSSINNFNDPQSEAKVLLASTKACCEGINLVGASRVVLLDVAWNPSIERQAISRAYRLGQKKIVHVYRLITSDTMEGEKCCRQAKKDWFSNTVFFSSDEQGNDGNTSSNKMEDKILEEMVRLDKQKYIEDILQEYDELKLIDTFGKEYDGLN